MDLSLAEVVGVNDPNNIGVMQCKIKKLGNSEEPVYYTSPFATNTDGGFFSVPKVGVQILCCSPYGTTDWYYLGSTFAPESRDADGDAVLDGYTTPYERGNPDSTAARGKPQQLSFRGAEGGGLKISEQYNAGMFNHYTRLQGQRGAYIEVNDSPQTDSILLDSGNQARIKITSDPQNNVTAAASIELESQGPQKMINKGNETDLVVLGGGRDLNILNNATGADWGGPISCGNVNIQSKNNDVNILTKAEEGKIFIQCLNSSGQNQHIEIQTKGPNGTIAIKTTGNISIEAGGDINMNAGGQINMRSGGQTSLESTADIQTKAAGTFTVDAEFVRLAEPASIPGPPQSQSQENSFGEVGVTKY